MRAPLAIALAALLVAAAAPADDAEEASGTLLDRMVATIAPASGRGARILVTLSDLELEARIALVSKGGVRAAEGELSPDTLAATLDWLVAQHLLQAEAEQLEVAAVDPAALERARAAFAGALGEEGYARFLSRWELGEADLLRVLRRQLVVEGYLRSRLRLGANVSEEEVREAFEARSGELGGRSYDEARPLLRAQLERRRREEVVSALLADLRSRAEVRILLRLRPEAPASGPASDAPWYLPGEEAGG